MSESATSSRPIDWDLATRRAGALTRPGPRAEPVALQEFIGQLRASAQQAPALVGAVTGLTDAAARTAAGPVFVLDRARWSEANISMLRDVIGDVLPTPSVPWGGRMAGEELGGMLALLSARVLGQFDPWTTPANHSQPGRLMLVAPNIWQIGAAINAPQPDFGLWVCLHEQTHALQFAAAPWLADHLRTGMRSLMGTLADTDTSSERLRELLRALPEVVNGERNDAPAGALVDAVLSESERAAMAEIVAVMSLLEGHADVVMDAVGPRAVPSVRKIRLAFERRRNGAGPVDLLLRRILGLDAKLAQYRNGAIFVRAVICDVGHVGFNAVWASPGALPTSDEIADPPKWVRRIHG